MNTDEDLEIYKRRLAIAQLPPEERRLAMQKEIQDLEIRVNAAREAWGFKPSTTVTEPPAPRPDNVLPFRQRQECPNAPSTDLQTPA